MKEFTQKIDQLLKKRFFISPTANIYGGVSGLYDYGPYGVALKNNIINLWRKFFIEEENMYEIDACILTPYEVLKASGHVDKFTDLLVFDQVNGECYRADHLLEQELVKLAKHDEINDILNNIDKLTPEKVNNIFKKYNIRSCDGNEIGNCTHFNLIFQTSIGPKSKNVSFLRPETAQSQFVNFKKLYDMNNEKLPFASASIGKVFRNEISPRSGLLRVREFEQAEIEYYVHPNEKSNTKFQTIKDLELCLFFEDNGSNIQQDHIMKLGDAVDKKIIDNETLGYFMGRTYLFLDMIGIKNEKLRFRQHKKDEMAHYATDCWDAEILTSYGWIECVGIADRACYDLSMHQKHSGINFNARRMLKEPIEKDEWVLYPNKKIIGQKLKNEMGNFCMKIENMSQEEIIKLLNNKNDCENINSIDIRFNNENYQIDAKKEKKKIFVEEFLPCVIEPSFGIGRILYSLIEHCYWTRINQEERIVLNFKPIVAPVKIIVTTLRSGEEFKDIIINLQQQFKRKNMPFNLCERNVSIGKKYSCADEIGVPFFVTIDLYSLKDKKCTIRERDSMKQMRVNINEVSDILNVFINGEVQWFF